MATTSEIVVRVAKDQRSATMTVPVGIPAEQLSVSILSQIAQDAGVAVGRRVDERLRDLLHRCGEPHEEAITAVVAEVTEPVDGEDARIEWRPGFAPDDGDDHAPASADTDGPAADAAPADEPVDFYRTSRFVQVEKGDEVAILHSETAGTDGCDVCGGTLAARSGRPLPYRIDESLDVRPNGAVVAAQTGVLVLSAGVLRVTRLLDIAEYVDFSTGNIDFDGSVKVRAGIRDRFVVRATDDVTVEGLVEGATLVVGGTLLLKRGMASRDRGVIAVEGDCRGGFFNGVRGRVRGDLEVRRELMDCHLMVGGDVCAEGAAIVGGVLAVTGRLQAATLGSDGGAPTQLVLEEVPFAGARLARVERLLDELGARRKELRDKLQELFEGGARDSERGRNRIAGIEVELREIDARVGAAELLRREACEAIRSGRQLDVIVGREINRRVRMRIRGREFVFEERVRGPIRITRNRRDELVVQRPGAHSRPLFDLVRETNIAA